MNLQRSRTVYRALLVVASAAVVIAVIFAVLDRGAVAVAMFALAILAGIACAHFRLRLVLAAVHERSESTISRNRTILEERLQPFEARAAASMQFENDIREVIGRMDGMLVGLGSHSEVLRGIRRDTSRVTGFAEGQERELSSLNGKIASLADRNAQLRSALDETSRVARENLERIPQAVEQYRAMQARLVGDSIAMPPIGGWAMTASSLTEIVARVLDAEKHPNVLELGSGISTVWTSLALEHRGGGTVVSLEHEQQFLGDTASSLRAYGSSKRVRLIHAPLKRLELGGEEFAWYDIGRIPHDLKFDLLVVDGPPGAAGALTRYPALPMLADRLNPGALILLDDTIRPEERRTIDRWSKEFDGVVLERRLDKATMLRWNAATS
ncbi:class I SAM-dependent methyltransferase [Agrococcus sp. KRD186]|uniref:class I SAM-dependent methyltransferase n=1 Tax=Agrococcus sp. KRD186 TaxID=2729730 RepID=UPI0019D12A3E|nr:class I SAM-dependent methyltransferase [Agrococcus sp. KRD186]